MYKITLDSDIYLAQQEEIEKSLFDESALFAINEVMFKLYIGSITDDMIELLSLSDEPEIEEVLGVENNE